MSQCKGCGIELQSMDPKALGYVVNLNQTLCERCFKLQHYGIVTKNMQTGIDANKVIEKINQLTGSILWVVDLFNFEGSMIDHLNQKLPGKDIYLILTKRDVLPLTLTTEKITEFVYERLQAHDITIKGGTIVGNFYIEPHKKRAGLSEFGLEHRANLMDLIDSIEGNLIFMGRANTGKSTLINTLFQDQRLTVSRHPGTTLDVLKLVQHGRAIYDTPGIENPHSVLTHLKEADLKTVLPIKPIRPYVSQLNSDQSFAAGGLARLDVRVKGKASVVGYFSRQLPIHRGKLADADRLWKSHLNEMLKPSLDTSLLTMHTIQGPTDFSEKVDVVIAGLGWFSLKGEIEAISVRVHKGIDVVFRKAMI